MPRTCGGAWGGLIPIGIGNCACANQGYCNFTHTRVLQSLIMLAIRFLFSIGYLCLLTIPSFENYWSDNPIAITRPYSFTPAFYRVYHDFVELKSLNGSTCFRPLSGAGNNLAERFLHADGFHIHMLETHLEFAGNLAL